MHSWNELNFKLKLPFCPIYHVIFLIHILKYLIWNLVEKVMAVLLKTYHVDALLIGFKIIMK